MKRSDLEDVLAENEEILAAIARHAAGGPPPRIIGLTSEARGVLATPGGRETSKEFIGKLAEPIANLKKFRQIEQKNGKRPDHVLLEHVQATSQMIAAYASRLQWMAENL